MDRVKDKVAVVTGGGKGIGRACAEMLAREGARVILTQRSEQEGQQVASAIRDQGLQAAFVAQDVTRESDWEHVLEETRKFYGEPDILVNNAGIYIIEKLEQTSLDQWKKLMNINSMGVFLGMRAFAPAMEKSSGGSIVNMSSVAGVIGTPGHVLYSASKGAVLTMTKDVAIEYARRGVRVNAVQPGYVDTGMADYGAEEQDSTKKDLGQWHPMGRIGTPEEIAYAVLYLASDEAAFVTGASLLVDGGLCAQ